MRFDWRASAVAAAAAFLLSLLIGIIAGVPFGTLMLRAVVGAAVFAGGAIGVQLAMDRFLPELRQAGAGSSSDESQMGSRVDIVVDDDTVGGAMGGSDFELDEGSEQDSEGVLEDVGADSEEAQAAAMDGSSYDGVESASPDEHIDHAARESGFEPGLAAEAVVSGDDGDQMGELEEAGTDEDEVLDAEPVDEAEPTTARRPESASSAGAAGEPEVLEEVEDAAGETSSAAGLPDIEGFSGSFADSTVVSEEPEETTSSGEDPGMMARAIRTVLKREE